MSTPSTAAAPPAPARTPPGSTFAPRTAWPARAVARAEAPLTARTDRYMRGAAHAVAAAARAELRRARGRVAGARVLLLVGGGHNGADTLLAGGALARRGCTVTAALATDRPHAQALAQARRAGVRTVEDDSIDPISSVNPIPGVGAAPPPGGPAPAGGGGRGGRGGKGAGPDAPDAEPPGGARFDLVLDGLTGIGATGALRPRAADLIAPLQAAGPPGQRPFRVLAVDLPSGTGVDDGTLPGPVLAADRTVTFTCLKGAHLLPPAAPAAGIIETVDLGLPLPPGPPLAVSPDDGELAALLHAPGPQDHKYTRGVLGLWAGSQTYPGAAVLTASAAVRCGAGMVRLAAPRRVEDLVLAARPEVVAAPGRCQALVIGPGTDPADEPRAQELRRALRGLMRRARPRAAPQSETPAPPGAGPLPAVIDAGALPLVPALLATGARLGAEQVLTPHAGEAAALLTALGEPASREKVEAAPARAADRIARLTGATVLLKGTPTLIAPPWPSPVLCVDPGPGWLATAGSGDVLAGILGALLAGMRARQEASQPGPGDRDTPRLAALAVRLHALAGHCAAGSQEPSGPGSGRPLAALDIAGAVPRAWTELRAHSPAQGACAPHRRAAGGPGPATWAADQSGARG